MFGQVPGYKDADALLAEAVNYQTYNNALSLEQKGLVQSALAAYQSLPEDFADVADRIAALQEQVGPIVEDTDPADPEGDGVTTGEGVASEETEVTE